MGIPALASAKMGMTLTVAVLTFSLLYLAWLANRLRLQQLSDEASNLKVRVMSKLQY